MNTRADAAPTMRAILHPRYGTPDVLSFGEIARPIPGDEDVLVRVHAALASVGDHHVVTGKPYVIRLSVPRPRNLPPGTTMAGRVEAVGANVTAFRAGDEIYGDARTGAFAEYVVVSPQRIALKPTNLTFEEAAAAAWGVTALQGLRDAGRLQPGQRVLINGASGGVGTWAVQIAKALGAEVTAVCSTRNVAMVRALGADHVIDYSHGDFVEGATRFDLVFDTVGNRSMSDCRSVLTPKGTYVSCAGGGSGMRWLSRIAVGLITQVITRQRHPFFVVKPNQEDLLVLKELIEAGKARPVIERSYMLSEVATALRQVGEGRGKGQTVIRVVAS